MDKVVLPEGPNEPAAETPVTQQVNPDQEDRVSRRQIILRWTGVILVSAAVLMLYYGGVAYYGWQEGTARRLDLIEATRTADLNRQMELAHANVGDGNYVLALRRLDSVLARDSQYPEAAELRATAQSAYEFSLIPTATPTLTPSPTVTPTPTNTPTPLPPAEDEEALADGFERLEELVEDQDWEAAIIEIDAFRNAYPNYERRGVDELLYESYVNYGLLLTRSETLQIERGLFYLALAQDLGDLSDEVQGEVFWAEQYLEGIVYYELNWPAYLSYFQPMCEFAPLFQRSCELYEEGLVRYAQQLALNLDWCPAAVNYRQAIIEGATSETVDLREQLAIADQACLAATPTPAFPSVFTDTVPIDNNGVVITPVPGAGGGPIPPVITITPP